MTLSQLLGLYCVCINVNVHIKVEINMYLYTLSKHISIYNGIKQIGNFDNDLK